MCGEIRVVLHHSFMQVNTLHNSSDEELSLFENRFYSNNIATFSQGYVTKIMLFLRDSKN